VIDDILHGFLRQLSEAFSIRGSGSRDVDREGGSDGKRDNKNSEPDPDDHEVGLQLARLRSRMEPILSSVLSNDCVSTES
jgi:hypothetical protein